MQDKKSKITVFRVLATLEAVCNYAMDRGIDPSEKMLDIIQKIIIIGDSQEIRNIRNFQSVRILTNANDTQFIEQILENCHDEIQKLYNNLKEH